jgi:phosphatidylglycerol:prolipoprotein diacylglycerol transferase
VHPTVVKLFDGQGFSSFGLLIPAPGHLYAVVAVVCMVLFFLRLQELRISVDVALEACVLGGVGALAGARFFWLATRGGFATLSVKEWFLGGEAGTASWGAYLGAMIAVCFLALARHLPVRGMLDAGASFAPLASAIGRWDCFLRGDDFGKVTDLAFGISFPANSPAWEAHVAYGLIDASASVSLPVYPTQILLSVAALLAFFATSRAWSRYKCLPGYTTGIFLLWFGGLRFPVEFTRSPYAGGARAGLSHSQWMCIAFIVAGLFLMTQAGKKRPL